MAAAAAEAIWVAGKEVAPANHVVEGPAVGLLYEEASMLDAEARPMVAATATRWAENCILFDLVVALSRKDRRAVMFEST